MPTEQKTTSDKGSRNNAGWGTLVTLCVVALALWGINWYFVANNFEKWDSRGQFGDMFGAVNALFTALAFSGLAYTILLQREELAQQRKYLDEANQTQKTLLHEQQVFQNDQRQKQEDALKTIESSRQNFLEKADSLRRQQNEQLETTFRENILRAIRSELEALNEIFENGTGKLLKDIKDGDYHNSYFIMSQNFFSVYEANAVNLGKLDAQHSRQIVLVYTLLKLLVEELRANNSYLAAQDEATVQMTGDVGSKYVELTNRKEQTKRHLVAQVKNIKRAHQASTEAISKFLQTLDQLKIK